MFKIFNAVYPSAFKNISRTYAQARKPRIDKKLQATRESLAARGFLRPYKPYSPPKDVNEKLERICNQNSIKFSNITQFSSLEQKFSILRACCLEFDHAVPNSKMHAIDNMGDLIEFYGTPVETRTPYDALKTMDLPKNLHVQYEYKRFHPETDTLFNGLSAFPKSSTLVTGLKYRKKYEGHEAKRSWP